MVLYCNVIWSLSIIVCCIYIGTKVNQNLGDFNSSPSSSKMKSSPEMKFISVVILFVTIFNVAKDSYLPSLVLDSRLAPCSTKTLVTSILPQEAAKWRTVLKSNSFLYFYFLWLFSNLLMILPSFIVLSIKIGTLFY